MLHFIAWWEAVRVLLHILLACCEQKAFHCCRTPCCGCARRDSASICDTWQVGISSKLRLLQPSLQCCGLASSASTCLLRLLRKH